MDKSQEYVWMCIEASEIIGRWRHSERNDGDFYYNKQLAKVYLADDDEQHDDICVWIPRFDQLMDIWKEQNPVPTAWNIIRYFYMRTATDEKGLNSYYVYFDTIEKVALCFLMREMYNKRWDWDSNMWKEEA